ncbi:LRRN4 C-terminal-like protein [Polymixia lowei]
MSLRSNLVLLLLFLTPDSFLPSLLFTHAVPTSPPITRPRILFVTDVGPDDDYYDGDYSDKHSSPPSVPSSIKPTLLPHDPQPCQYNPCLENQEPCAQLSSQTGCLCPGLSGANQPPHPPRLQGLVPVNDGDGRGKVEVQWCAPSSVVSRYRVVVEGSKGGALEFGEALRHGLVGSLEVGANVCVEAVNMAGHSGPSEFSCLRYDPTDSPNYALTVGVIGGGVAFLLLVLIAALILWKRQACRKAMRGSTEGLGNPSYSTEGNL